MSTTFLTLLAAALAANAGSLWLTCRWLNVRRPATPERRGVTFRRALSLAACGLAVTTLVGAWCWSLMDSFWLALNAHAVVSLAASMLFLRFGLPVGWRKALAVEAVWTLASIPAAFVGTLIAFDVSVVPGQEMADAVRGAHREAACPQCGHGFAVEPRGESPDGEDDCVCPNCRLPIAFAPAGVVPPRGFVAAPAERRRDRVLMLGSLLRGSVPERFDVVGVRQRLVVHNRRAYPAPSTFLRVIGLPGEVVVLHRGDAYVAESGALKEDDAPGRELVGDADVMGGAMLLRDLKTWRASERLLAQARLVRKPPAQVLAMMRLVYDSRHPAADLTLPHERRWAEDEGSGWRADGTGFRHDGNAREDAWLRYRHVLRLGFFQPSLITDVVVREPPQPIDDDEPRQNWVGDLILECDVEVGTSGEWALELSRGPDRFQARFDLTAGTCALIRLAKGEPAETLATARVRLPADARVRFANVDRRLIVWVNGRLLFGDGVPYDGTNDLMPERANDLDRPASVAVNGAALRVRRLRLLRDTYYAVGADVDLPRWGGRRPEAIDPADPATWGRMRREAVAHRVGADECFLVGDNRAAGADWPDTPFIPCDKIAGKALLRLAPLSRVGWVE